MPKATILVADDHKIVLEGLRGVLENDFDLIGQVTNGRDLVKEALRLKPDVVVADISMTLLNGIEAVRQLRAKGSGAKVVFLTMHADQTYATRALEAGGSGYVLKHAAPDELVDAIHAALKGKTYVSRTARNAALTERIDQAGKTVRTAIELTARQREVLQLLAEGKSAKEIGSLLEISARTVETHKYNMMDELGLKTTAQLVQYAIRHGIASEGGAT